VTHDEQSHRLVAGEESTGPFALASGCPFQLGFIDGMIAEEWAQRVNQPESQVRVQYPVDRGGGGMLNHSVNQSGLPSGLRQTVPVNRCHSAMPDLEGGLPRLEAQTEVLFPEVPVPPVMISPDHHDRYSAAEPSQGGGNVEATSRNHPGVGKPEIEEVAIDEQAVAQLRHRGEKLEESLFYHRRRHSKVGIGDDDEGVAQHGAKDGSALSSWQPRSFPDQRGIPRVGSTDPSVYHHHEAPWPSLAQRYRRLWCG
jgi:hypothetical protein